MTTEADEAVTQDYYIVDAEGLRRWTTAVFRRLSVTEEDARTVAEVLVSADLRGWRATASRGWGDTRDGCRVG
ncbi:MAG: hypothetical protein WKH64_08035 [Chloroflexia bacterium]